MRGSSQSCARLLQFVLVLCLCGAWLAGPTPVEAQGWIAEGKLGVLAHDIRFLGNHVENGADLNAEVLFTSPSFLRIIGAPRVHIGGAVNTAGKTNYGYVGLTWRTSLGFGLLPLADALFVAGSLGGGMHDGQLNSGPPDRKLLGSRLLFRESVELGYQLTRLVSVSVLLDHLSNAELARHNQGLTNIGMRLGFAF